MKVTIITVCFNSEKTIEDAILSVASQKGVEVEHIIIDGASSDGTLSIVKAHKRGLTYISEPDSGIYDAMNKGLRMSTGDIIGTLNSDDFYLHDHVLKRVVDTFEHKDIDACYADLVYVRQTNVEKVVRYWQSKSYTDGLFKSGWMPAHPTFFAKKSVYKQYGEFNTVYKIAADFELLFRFIEKFKIKCDYIPEVLVKMRMGGTTNNSFCNIYKQNKEIINVLRHYYRDFSILTFLFKKLSNRTIQFIIHK